MVHKRAVWKHETFPGPFTPPLDQHNGGRVSLYQIFPMGETFRSACHFTTRSCRSRMRR